MADPRFSLSTTGRVVPYRYQAARFRSRPDHLASSWRPHGDARPPIATDPAWPSSPLTSSFSSRGRASIRATKERKPSCHLDGRNRPCPYREMVDREIMAWAWKTQTIVAETQECLLHPTTCVHSQWRSYAPWTR